METTSGGDKTTQGKQAQSFKGWVNSSLIIAPHPSIKPDNLDLAYKSDIVINVSDLLDWKLQEKLTAKGIQTYWFPLGESYGLPLENI